jgi:hypothetical protein
MGTTIQFISAFNVCCYPCFKSRVSILVREKNYIVFEHVCLALVITVGRNAAPYNFHMLTILMDEIFVSIFKVEVEIGS